MQNAVIVHGMPGKDEYYSDKYPSASNFQWLPWLQKQLIIRDIKADTPEMPYAFAPDYDVWKREFERYEITPETILVGHSCGAGFLVRWLSENPEVLVGKVVLVAPWLDVGREDTTDFFDFEIDSDLILRTKGITIFHSDNDTLDINKSVSLLEEKITGLEIKLFSGYGHFTGDDLRINGFPELLAEVLK